MSKSANVVRAVVLAAVVLALAVLPTGTAMAADEKVSLTPKYLPGKYVINMVVDSESTVAKGDKEMPGGKISMDETMNMTFSQPDEKGNMELTMQYTKFKYAMSVPGQGEASYSTSLPSDETKEPWAAVVKSPLAGKITATYGPDGSISNVKGTKELLSSMYGDTTSTGVRSVLASHFSEKGLNELFENSRKMLPMEPVAAGQEYKNTAKAPHSTLGELDVIIEGKIVSIDKTDKGRVATIEYKSKVDKKSPATQPVATSQPTMYDTKQIVITMKGQIKFNIDIGLGIEQKADQVTEMDLVAGNETLKVKQSISMTANATFTPAK